MGGLWFVCTFCSVGSARGVDRAFKVADTVWDGWGVGCEGGGVNLRLLFPREEKRKAFFEGLNNNDNK